MTQRNYNQSQNIELREKLDPSQIFFIAVKKCMDSLSGANPSIFEADVRGLLVLLPKYKQDKVYERESEFTVRSENWVYQYNCGTRMGSPSNPILDNDPDDLSYDPTKPSNPISPILQETETTDYEKLYSIIMNESEDAGLMWSMKEQFKEIGLVVPQYDIPKKIISEAVKALANIVIYGRENCETLSYRDLIEACIYEKPATPVLMFVEGSEPMPIE